MESNITSKLKVALKYTLLLVILSLNFGQLIAQGNLTTTYTPTSGLIGGNVGITFVVQNTNATARVLNQIDMNWDPFFTTGPTSARLWYSATSLSGLGTVASPAWTLASATTSVNVTGGGIIPTFRGLNIVIPANTQYRFAVESTNGVIYGAAATTPNSFTADGVVLKVGNNLIAGSNVGYALNPMPNLANNPRFFSGAIYWTLATPCTGAPAPTATTSTRTEVCPTDNFTLATTVAAGTTGITYQWQSAATAAGPWTNIAGATFSTLLRTQSTTTFYRNAVTCTAGTTTNSSALQVTMKTICYCAATATDTQFEKIGNVSFGTINNSSSLTTGYSDYTSISTSLAKGSNTPITITGAGTYGLDGVNVWIDYNQDGDFVDAGENVYSSAISAGPYTSTITIPLSALSGSTTMRVRLYDVTGNGVTGPCGTADYGEVEDYTINVTACIPVTVTSQPANSTVGCGANTTFKIVASGTGLTYQWQQRNNATSAWNTLTNTGVYLGTNTATLTITGAPVTLSGNQYRVVYTGGCSATEFSTIVTLTVNPLVATVNPSATAICKGSIAQLTLTNPTLSPTYGVPSGVPLAIPDADVTGINSTINVSGIPVSAAINSVSVTLNITHPWVSDLMIVLRSPNGQIINLSNLVSGTNRSGANFVNTVFSSAGTAAISTGIRPGHTGTFRADAIPGPLGAFGAPAGPDGFLPTTTTWTSLYGTINGNWTIAMYDAGAPDAGTLTNWSINIDFVTSPAQGTWTTNRPLPASMFTDAAATIPYVSGTLANSIYVKPDSTTNYSVVYSNGICTSAATVVPVTVNAPATAVSVVANKTICPAGNTSFTATPSGGFGNTYQWQVSTDAGATFTNVTNGGVYAGATTTTLSLTAVPVTFNNNRYRLAVSAAPCVGTVNSNAATLTVNPTPVIVVTANSLSAIYPGQTTTLSAAVSPNAAATYTWFRDGVAVSTATTFIVDVDKLGLYTVRVIDDKGCSATSAGVRISAAANDLLFIYPSPNTGQFQVRFFNQLGSSPFPRTVSVFDSKGTRVYTRSYPITSSYTRLDVDLKNQAKGIYTVELTDSRGNRIKTGRVLVL